MHTIPDNKRPFYKKLFDDLEEFIFAGVLLLFLYTFFVGYGLVLKSSVVMGAGEL